MIGYGHQDVLLGYYPWCCSYDGCNISVGRFVSCRLAGWCFLLASLINAKITVIADQNKNISQVECAAWRSRGTAFRMAPPLVSRKRKTTAPESPVSSDLESNDEFGDGLLDGILSQSEDESEISSDEDGEDSEDDKEGLEELDSDEMLSQDENERANEKPRFVNGSSTAEDSTVKSALGDTGYRDDVPNYRVETDANGGERYVYDEIEPGYDSDDSDAPVTANTVGNISLSFYDSYPHIGYDINGKKIMRPAKGEALDALLDSIEVPKGWTGLTDPATGKPLNLSQEELEVLRRIQMNEVPEEGYDPYPVSPHLVQSRHVVDPSMRLPSSILQALKKLCH